jgi:uncharacterized protein (UPF0261 family)
MIGLEISGVKELLAGFEDYKKESDKAILQAVGDTARAVEKDAKMRLKSGLQKDPKHKRDGTLWGSIMRMKKHEKDKFEAVVGTGLEYAPYIEFGTGDLVEIPEGAEAVAAQYRGKGLRNYAAVKNKNKFIEALEKRLNAIKR